MSLSVDEILARLPAAWYLAATEVNETGRPLPPLPPEIETELTPAEVLAAQASRMRPTTDGAFAAIARRARNCIRAEASAAPPAAPRATTIIRPRERRPGVARSPRHRRAVRRVARAPDGDDPPGEPPPPGSAGRHHVGRRTDELGGGR